MPRPDPHDPRYLFLCGYTVHSKYATHTEVRGITLHYEVGTGRIITFNHLSEVKQLCQNVLNRRDTGPLTCRELRSLSRQRSLPHPSPMIPTD